MTLLGIVTPNHGLGPEVQLTSFGLDRTKHLPIGDHDALHVGRGSRERLCFKCGYERTCIVGNGSNQCLVSHKRWAIVQRQYSIGVSPEKNDTNTDHIGPVFARKSEWCKEV